ncbi:hypothetical protein TVAG_351410 [Trichomonas vaginalis G3]|uniref:Uncharacterized protein n=1 Tax=Trichomonas vaginalis (strain ATCC PRA-98 / G3) TaxID=412133 RepID=A2DZM5_TRIV3|nr:protein of unknown function (DUF3447) [Trichomonas vaginalis G3]EAY14093.1 hypothetical protein TVAG_351410 [Trichomonas vaginalis G3]KAI5525103.1 protein of unknown function (DUF3447) [Trichomonas vaginalis G3]|eukprot:XP_001326316.1 hypothetical protein [Trichomonas vaginalis G3]
MTDQDIHRSKYSELRDIYKYHIDSYIALYQLKTGNDEDFNSIYKMIKTELIDSKRYFLKIIIKDILNVIKYNNRYTKSYLKLAKFITDDYHVTNVPDIEDIPKYMFYKEYGIKLDYSDAYKNMKLVNFNLHSENTT